MPVIPASSYHPRFPFTLSHVATIYASKCRPCPRVRYTRERIDTPDGDFLDLDWSRVGSSRLAVISHGLEGNARRCYTSGAALALNQAGWDCLNLNFRGCSGEPNRTPRFYHSGTTDDLHTALTHALHTGGYATAGLVGFSIGGNQTLKYLGENPEQVPRQVRCAAAFSVPCELVTAAAVMASPANRIYMRYFMRTLVPKVREKAARFPELGVNLDGIEHIRIFPEFDDRYTAPLHGFSSALDYYQRASSLQFLESIRIPTLLVNAKDDPFLSAACYPAKTAANNPDFFLESPAHGGHVGFVPHKGKKYWSESRLVAFFTELR